MEASNSSNASIFNLVTTVAVLFSQDESAQSNETAATVPPLASISKTRTKIYESLLKPRLDIDSTPSRCLKTLPQCRKFLDEQGQDLSLSLGSDIASCLQNLCKSKESQQSDAEECIKNLPSSGVFSNQSRIMLAMPLRLQSDPSFGKNIGLCSTPPGPGPLRSIENMRNSMKPVCYRRLADFNLRDIGAMRNAQRNATKSMLRCSILKDSMSRIKESQRGRRRFKVDVPAWNKGTDLLIESNEDKALTLSVALEKRFVSDLVASNELKRHQDQTLQLIFIELPLLIEHLKQAASGLQSETIICTDDGSFMLQSNITLSSILPELLSEFAEPFLASGKAYRRICARIQWHHAANRFERPLNRTLRQAVTRFLSNSRLFFLSLSANSLSQLLRGAGPTMKMLQQMDQMFQAEECLNEAGGMSGICGINLLRFVWSSMNVGIDCQFSQLLIFLLRSLSKTYFAQLQRWLYHGELEDPLNELFISYCSHTQMDERSKEFFEKAYYVRSEMVPGFLAGFEQAILQCGKYNRFLKNYNPQHAIFNLKYPELVVCLSEKQLTAMRQALELHSKQVMQQITPFDRQSVFVEQTEKNRRYGNRMWECTQAHIAAWEEQQEQLLQKVNVQKQLRYKELNEQREQQEQLQLEKRRLEVVMELEFQQKCDAIEEQRLQEKKQALQTQVNVWKPAKTLAGQNDGEFSLDDSSSSSRSFVSCEEPDSELATDKPDLEIPPAYQADWLNSNKNDMDLNRIRMRNNSSEQFRECQMQVRLREVPNTSTSTTALTEAERNRLRVLSCTEELPPDMNMNLEDLTDLQRNRQRMQKHNSFASFNNDEVTKEQEKQRLPLDTDLARSHRHFMGGDFKSCKGFENPLHLPLEPQKLCVETTLGTVDTPMSTTSDVDIEVDIPDEIIDAANNNNLADNYVDNSNNFNQTSESTCATAAEPECATDRHREPALSLLRTVVEERSNSWGQAHEIGHNPFTIKRYMQLSVLVPLKLHLSLLRNEVLRIFHEKNVFEHFNELRKYFFLLDGEFGNVLISGILEKIESGVAPHNLCQKSVLDSLLNNALGNRTGGSTSPGKVFENLALNCTHIPESFDLMDINVMSIFKLDWKVEWPLNLVFSAESMERYCQIFSNLAKVRHVNFIMERAYQDFQQTSRLLGRALQQSTQYRHLQMVRHKLSHFVITLQNYLVTNALEGTWKSFTDDLKSIDAIEGLYQRHAEYLKEIVFFSLLNRRSAKFRETMDNILLIGLRFCKILNTKTFVLEEDTQQFVHPRYKRLVHEEAEFEKFIRYAIYLGNKCAASGYQEKIVDLIRIINYNNYYIVSDSSRQVKC